jgi:hypothetical protein
MADELSFTIDLEHQNRRMPNAIGSVRRLGEGCRR